MNLEKVVERKKKQDALAAAKHEKFMEKYAKSELKRKHATFKKAVQERFGTLLRGRSVHFDGYSAYFQFGDDDVFIYQEHTVDQHVDEGTFEYDSWVLRGGRTGERVTLDFHMSGHEPASKAEFKKEFLAALVKLS
jgi:hypothetical protein